MDKPDTYRLSQVTRYSQTHWDAAWEMMVSGVDDTSQHMGLWTIMCNSVDRLGGAPVIWMEAIIKVANT